MIKTHFYHSPIGWIKFEETESGLISLNFSKPPSTPQSNSPTKLISDLDSYFKHSITDWNTKLIPAGTAFQKRTWEIVKSIPKGRTKTYKDIALALGDIKAIRAVANGIGKNPILLFIPCHRVIGSDGSMTGYAGGIEKKRWLLTHEGVSIQKTLDL
jgi:methylated-DNA-[protein]-cysteine S-methyltransferase